MPSALMTEKTVISDDSPGAGLLINVLASHICQLSWQLMAEMAGDPKTARRRSEPLSNLSPR